MNIGSIVFWLMPELRSTLKMLSAPMICSPQLRRHNRCYSTPAFAPPKAGRTSYSIISVYHHSCNDIQGNGITALCRISRDVFVFPPNKENSNKLDFRVNVNKERWKRILVGNAHPTRLKSLNSFIRHYLRKSSALFVRGRSASE